MPIGSSRFRAVIGMTFIIMLGFGVVVPAISKFVEDFGGGPGGVGAVVLGFSITRLFGDFFAGPLLDRYGDRAITAIGAAIVGISSIAAGMSQSFAQLFVLRGLGGVGSAFFLGGLMAFIIGSVPPTERGRAMAIFQGSFGVGLLIGFPAGSALLSVVGARWPFHIYGIVLLVSVPLCLRALALQHAPAPPDVEAINENAPVSSMPSFQRLKPLLKSRAYRAALASSALLFLIGQAQFTLVPLFWRDILHQPLSGAGIPLAIYSLFGLLVITHSGRITDRLGRKSGLVPALLVTAIGTAAMGFSESWVVFMVLMALTGAAYGYIRPGPGAIVGDVSNEQTRAIAVSGYRIAGDIGAIIGPALAGVLARAGSFSAFRNAWVGIGAIAVVVFVLAVIAEETLPRRARV
jgi:MFS family permease